jgi:L,D-peptidoglycan transpeptidase YkuD (ErfK/YbiS/YcfS/YnhG family)
MKLFAFALFGILVASATAQVKTPEPVQVKVPFEKSLQAIVVTTKDWNAIQGRARLFERKDARSKWKATGDDFDVVIGRSGLAWGEDAQKDASAAKIKKEGDGNSPAGRFPLKSAFGSGTKPNAVELPYTKLDEFTECVDDVNSSFYNRIVNRMQVGNFDWKSSEKMLAVGPEYGLGMFVAYNTFPVVRGNGSCIFMHVWKDAATGTSGCTAMERLHLERVVAWAQPAKNPYLVQLPEDVYDKYRKTWNLPKIK